MDNSLILMKLPKSYSAQYILNRLSFYINTLKLQQTFSSIMKKDSLEKIRI